MKPSKFCNAIQCTDCRHYQECLEWEYRNSKGYPLEIKVTVREMGEENHGK